jgi:adenylate cyclase
MTESGGLEIRQDRIDLAHVGEFALDQIRVRPALCEVVAGDRSIRVQPRVMQVLVAMAQADGEVVSRDQFANRCWGGVAVGEDALNRCIGQLRRLLESAPALAIETLPGVGYRLIAPADPLLAEGASRRGKPGVAVLPFANMSGDPEQEYFSDGITEDVTTDLSKISSLFVAARHATFAFKGKTADMRELARELGVTHVLEGSVRKAGGRVRITAQLIDGDTGGHAWADRWDRDLDDIFALQDEISQAIVAALKLTLLPEEKQAIERRGTDSAEAYDLHLLARSYLLTGNVGDLRRWEAIERLCRQAISLDQGYAQAWALMALALYNLHHSYGRASDGSYAALERALTLNPDLADARSLRAKMLSDEGRHGESAAEISVALRLDPDSYEVVWRAGYVHCAQGRLEDAARHFEKAAALIETELQAIRRLISCYAALGDAGNTRRAAAIALGRAEQAVAQDRGNGFAMSVAVTALAALGETERAREWTARAMLIDPDNLVMRFNLACVFATSLGDPEAALALMGPVLERVSGAQLLWDANSEPAFARLRADPRFEAMLAQAKVRVATAAQA